MRYRFRVYAILILVLLSSVMLGTTFSNIVAQSGEGWSVPQVLLEPAPDWDDVGATLVTDRAGFAHLAWLHGSDTADQAVFFYSRWNGTDWTPPVDVFAANDNFTLGWPILVTAPDGWLHIFWNSRSYLYHSQAWGGSANSPRSWETPDVVISCDDSCSVPMDAVLDDDGVFHIVYTRQIGDVYYIKSDDGGMTWSSPVAVSSVAPSTTTFLPKLAVAADGRIHTVWTEMPVLYVDVTTFRVNYAHSRDGGITWSAPVELGGRFHSNANVMVAGYNTVYVAWNGGVGTNGRYFQYSKNGGETWSTPIKFSQKSGQTGYPGMALDGAGVLHIVTGDGEYVIWDGQSLSALFDRPSDEIYIERLRLVTVTGNQLLVIWPSNFKGMYSTFRQINVPAVSALLPPTPMPVLLATPNSTAIVVSTPSNTTFAGNDTPSLSKTSVALPIMMAVGASLIIVFAELFFHLWRKRR